MENLYLKLELLLGDFVAGFLNKLIASDDFQPHQPLPKELKGEYLDYLKQFRDLQLNIEEFPAKTGIEANQRSRALALLKSSSASIYSTFLTENQ